MNSRTLKHLKVRTGPVGNVENAKLLLEMYPAQPSFKMLGQALEISRGDLVQLIQWMEANEVSSIPVALRTLALAALSEAPGWRVYHLKRKAWMLNVRSTLTNELIRALRIMNDEMAAGIDAEEADIPPDAVQYVVGGNNDENP